MTVVFRSAAWIALYAILVTAPLAVASIADPVAGRRPFALELGVACGLVAFALIVLEVALVARVRTSSALFGTDALVQFHKLLGVTALTFLAAHAALLWSAGGVRASMLDPFRGAGSARTGAAALWGVVLLVGTSVWRRWLRIPYEAWRFGHRLLTVVVVGTMLLHVADVGAYWRAPAVRGVLAGEAAVFAGILGWYAVVRPLGLWRRPWEVVANRDEGGDTRSVIVRPVGHRGIRLEPGQFAWLTTGATPFHPQQHPLSISSSAEPSADGRIEFTIKALGRWSRESVPRLLPGARVWVDGPFGALSPDRTPAQGFFLVAGGIGIAPMRSILLTLRDRGDPRPAVLVYAARNASRTVFAGELDELRRTGRVEVVYVFTDPEPGWDGERGYVTTELLRRHLPAGWDRFQFFVCGPPPMLRALEHALAKLPVDPERIQTERFDIV